jgi:hypothetical protein
MLELLYGLPESDPVLYDGSEGELYNLDEDPLQWRNLWDDPGSAALRSDLVADLLANLPPPREPKLAWNYMG